MPDNDVRCNLCGNLGPVDSAFTPVVTPDMARRALESWEQPNFDLPRHTRMMIAIEAALKADAETAAT